MKNLVWVALLVVCFGWIGALEAKEKTEKKGSAKKVEKKTEKKAEKKESVKKETKRSDGLVIVDLKEGTGEEAKLGSRITVHYRGTLKNGKEFDSSYSSGMPITFELLEGRLIRGWTEGIPGMKVGGKRRLEIPYALAYGERGTPNGEIPPKSDLDFEVELVKIEK
ncbi:MAG: FKBP-type peptidyl-prolyl cis-trans isomerase [Oligoflexia bacterium]|nr:FKBP-type peptidyl-prolyl cis-trans isomerase [Oligoflexia bacterium]